MSTLEFNPFDDDPPVSLPIEERKPCEHEGCTELGDPYSLPLADEDETPSYYCVNHATEAGFCIGCRYFCAGQESFDFSRSGLCGDCAAEARDHESAEDFEDWLESPF